MSIHVATRPPEPTAVVADRFVTEPNVVVATGARSTPGGTVMLSGWPAVEISPVAGSTVV